MIEVDLGHRKPSTHLLKIGEQALMLKGEMDIGLRPATTPPPPSKQGEPSIRLTFSGDVVGGDGRVGYMSQTSRSSYQRGYGRVTLQDMEVGMKISTNLLC